jgi:hypothetical protein
MILNMAPVYGLLNSFTFNLPVVGFLSLSSHGFPEYFLFRRSWDDG